MKSVFEFSTYKTFLSHFEQARKPFERGFRSKLADFIGCQSGYVTRVLNGSAHFSLEQGLKICSFLQFNEREQNYFILLIEKERAGTKELKVHFEKKLQQERESFLNIRERVGNSRTLSELEQSVYYSSWHYLAIHMLITIAGHNDPHSIANALRIPESVAAQSLLFLLQSGIVEKKNGKLQVGVTQVHLSRESPMIRQHHTNWRIAAIQSLAENSKSDIHYSTVSTMSKADAEKLRLHMVKFIEDYVAVVKPSSEEVMYGFNLDFYGLVGSF